MNRLGWMLVGGAWSAVVFGGVFWLTFPSEALGQRLAYQVGKASQGRWALQLDGASPWWFGIRGDNVILSERVTDGTLEPRFFADEIRVRVGATSLLRKTPAITGAVTMGGATLDFFVRAVLPGMDLRVLQIRGDGVDLGELLALVPGGASLGLSGPVDVDIDLQLAGGFSKTEGKVELLGKGLTLDTITVESLGWVDKEIGAAVQTLDLRVDFDEGHGRVSEGTFASSLADIEIRGDVELADDLSRSRLDLDLTLELGDWTGTPLEAMRAIVESQLAAATHADGKAHFEVESTFGRLDAGDLRPVRERGSRASRAGTGAGAGTTSTSGEGSDRDFAAPFSRIPPPPSASAGKPPAEPEIPSRFRRVEEESDEELDELEEVEEEVEAEPDDEPVLDDEY